MRRECVKLYQMRMLNTITIKATALCVSMIFVVLSAIISFQQPFYDTDMLFYSGIYYEEEFHDPTDLHKQVYEKVWLPLDSASRQFLNEKPLEVRAKESADFYNQQLPFYKIKPAYNFLVRQLTDFISHNPLKSMQWINVIAYILTAIIIVAFLFPHLSALYLSVTVVGTICLPLTIAVSRMFTPDMSSVLFLMCGFYFLTNAKHNLHLAFLSLIISILFRPDNVMMVILIAALFASITKSNYQILISYVLLSLIIYLSIGIYYQGYGWKITFQHSAIDLAVSPESWESVPLTLKDYISTVLTGVLTYKMLIISMLFISSVLYAIMCRDKQFQSTSWKALILANLIINPLRFLLFPIFDDRYYLSFYLLALIVLCMHVFGSYKNLKTE